MTDIPIPTGPTNKELVDLAYSGLAISDAMFGRTDEEYAGGVLLLRAMMSEWPFDQLGYDDSTARPSERSGIDRKWFQAVGMALAERIAPAIGKTMTREAVKVQARSYSRLCAGVAVVPSAQYGYSTPMGMGHRRSGTFFAEPD